MNGGRVVKDTGPCEGMHAHAQTPRLAHNQHRQPRRQSHNQRAGRAMHRCTHRHTNKHWKRATRTFTQRQANMRTKNTVQEGTAEVHRRTNQQAACAGARMYTCAQTDSPICTQNTALHRRRNRCEGCRRKGEHASTNINKQEKKGPPPRNLRRGRRGRIRCKTWAGSARWPFPKR